MLKFGYITNYDECGRVKVQIEDEDSVITDYIPVVRTSASKDDTGDTIDTNTFVAVILDDLNPLNGVCLGAVNLKPVKSVNKKYHQFSDGTSLKYDRETHVLTADVNGEITAKANKTTFDSPIYSTQDIFDKNGSMQSIRDFINNHTHSNGNNGANTGVPTSQI